MLYISFPSNSCSIIILCRHSPLERQIKQNLLILLSKQNMFGWITHPVKPTYGWIKIQFPRAELLPMWNVQVLWFYRYTDCYCTGSVHSQDRKQQEHVCSTALQKMDITEGLRIQKVQRPLLMDLQQQQGVRQARLRAI